MNNFAANEKGEIGGDRGLDYRQTGTGEPGRLRGNDFGDKQGAIGRFIMGGAGCRTRAEFAPNVNFESGARPERTGRLANEPDENVFHRAMIQTKRREAYRRLESHLDPTLGKFFVVRAGGFADEAREAFRAGILFVIGGKIEE